jgi:hypothetical protein
MDYPHIHRLQMACAILGEKYNFNIFQSNDNYWVCSTLANEEQDFCFLPSGDPIAQETPQKWLKSSIHWNLLCIWWEIFTFLKQWGLLYLPITSGANFSVPSALQPRRSVTLCFYFVPPWQESPSYVSVLLGC